MIGLLFVRHLENQVMEQTTASNRALMIRVFPDDFTLYFRWLVQLLHICKLVFQVRQLGHVGVYRAGSLHLAKVSRRTQVSPEYSSLTFVTSSGKIWLIGGQKKAQIRRCTFWMATDHSLDFLSLMNFYSKHFCCSLCSINHRYCNSHVKTADLGWRFLFLHKVWFRRWRHLLTLYTTVLLFTWLL